MPIETRIKINVIYLPSTDVALPALVLRVTVLEASLMIWIGTTEENSAELAEQVAERGSLAQDWACAMPPPSPDIPAAVTSLYRSSGFDVASSMAQRLARRFRKQIFLSVDLPPAAVSMGQDSRLLLELEKGIVRTVKDLEI